MHIDNFIRHLHAEKRYSKHTIIAYHNDLKQFNKFLKESYNICSFVEVTHQIVRSWIFELSSHSISANSINRKLSTLKTFFGYLRKNSIIIENPLSKISSPKKNKRLPEFVIQEQMDELFINIDNDKSFTGIRNKLIIQIFYFTGIRLSEMTHLRDHDIDISRQQLKVLGKRNKERLIPFGKTLAETIEEYLLVRKREIEKKEEGDFLLITKNGKKIYNKLIYRVVNSYLSKVSTLQKTSPHILRHTFATHMLNNGAELNAIKEILGHANLAATQVYTHNTIDKLKTIYNQAHPRA
ncbi:MAG: tyrosine-type recombinase/integrase [Bacteroidales bacterium]|nr:tyrosine-type recombinase/integrase [Bacteroidales bacterium]MCF8404985.1 tyrosine-type recombinase/integrase [Bacteroidales bacterium]